MPDSACERCGADLHPGDLFCGNCGAATGALTPPPPPTDPIAVAQLPTMPPPVGVLETSAVPLPPRPRRGRVLVGAAFVIAVAAIAALGLVLLSTRSDLDNERAKVAQLDAATTTTSAPATGAIGPVSPAGEDDLIALQNQLDQLNAALLQAKQDLTAEQAARTADSVAQAQQVADLQAQITQLQALFPVTAAALAAADPTGQYTVTLTAGECTLADCAPIGGLEIQFTDATTIAGNRVHGATSFDGTNLTITGPLDPAVSPACAGQPGDASYTLTLHVTAADVADAKLRATQLGGVYTETVTGATETTAACAGQHRTYTVVLQRQ